MKPFDKWPALVQDAQQGTFDDSLFQSDSDVKNSAQPTKLPMAKVPTIILKALNPHHTDYIRIDPKEARYWHGGLHHHDDRQLLVISNNQAQRLKTVSQGNIKEIFAFIKKSALEAKVEGQFSSSGSKGFSGGAGELSQNGAHLGAAAKYAATSDYSKNDGVGFNSSQGAGTTRPSMGKSNAGIKKTPTKLESTAQPIDTIAPSVIIGQPNPKQIVKLEQNQATKRRFANHVLGPGETAASVVEQYTGTPNESRIYGFNHPQFTIKNPPKAGDKVRVNTGFDVLVKGQFYNSNSVNLIWKGPTSGSKSAILEQVNGNYIPDRGYDWELALPLVAGEYTLTAEAGGATHSVSFSVEESEDQLEIIDFIYIPEDNSFIAVTQSLADILEQEMEVLNPPMEQLKQALAGQQDLSKQDDKVIDAKKALNETLKPLVSGPTANKITEVIGFKGRKYTYVRSDKMANHFRRYKIDTDIRNGRRFSDANGNLDRKKLNKALKNDLSKLKVNFKYDKKLVDTYTTIWGEWARELNKDLNIKRFEKSDYFDASAEARLMRYTHGAGIAANFSPKDGVFSFQADGKVDFAVGEAKAAMSGYYPNKNGYEFKFMMPLKNTTKEREINLGAIRLNATIALFGYAGAKLQAAANVGCTVKQGKMMLEGLTPEQVKALSRADRKFEPVKGELSAFAGVSAGCELTGALQWDNPEKSGKSSFCDLAKLGGKAEGAFGAGAHAGCFIGYEDGRFILRAKLGLIWGVGAGGELVCEIGVDEIVTLAQFVYHQLKNNDYDYLEFIQPLAFNVLYKAVAMHIATGKDITEFVGGTAKDIDEWWRTKVIIHEQAKAIMQRVEQAPEMLKFTVPESKGAFLNLLANPNLASLIDSDTYSWQGLNEQRENTIIIILKHILCTEELDEVLQHMGKGGTKCSQEEGLSQLNSILEGAQQREFDAWRRKLPSRARSGSVAVAMLNISPFVALA
ncbi:hypothetical protein EXT48_19665 [Pseudoalteromonas sp. CO348]|uniref:hypothetical protein n=1 Tax=unclassified Pseudoalteromonas TaxID=194690 RepID=UPI0010231220|nr:MULTISPECIES: hypothetical protein [unclassified Pseudoalteromonas]MCG7539322.1 hypothetical protein [Pseudoalteromonas sp. OF7H-1]RZF99758.1 hypothetical protein EXT48_19665 [Pseudoalteromonas sp. CO348]